MPTINALHAYMSVLPAVKSSLARKLCAKVRYFLNIGFPFSSFSVLFCPVSYFFAGFPDSFSSHFLGLMKDFSTFVRVNHKIEMV